ncbi:Phosphoheptose isomerase 1 [hydrothermal vent metagenome]|uniref:Phosphoheptose isomerase 1 n=1 Tax=hydrothermal vent metagenome TaxID=652676 RepID=A0A3B0WTR3_9ZZZZ
MNLIEIIERNFSENEETQLRTLENAQNAIALAGQLMTQSLLSGGKILTCGNGGSAGEAQLFSSKMLNRFQMERPGLPAIALSTDTSVLTSIANDYSYDQIFSRQIAALGQPEDILLLITTSGNSGNLVSAVDTAHERQMKIIALTGQSGGEVGARLHHDDVEIRVASDSPIRIQEAHLLIIHCLGDLVDVQLMGG